MIKQIKHEALIGLGSNQENPVSQLKKALDKLNTHTNIVVQKCSRFYRSAPIGYLMQDNFVNAVVKIETPLSPFELLSVLQTIEKSQGKKKIFKDGPRTLDLDLLYFNNESIQHADLKVPHPRILERAFVLYPLQEIAPERVTPLMLTHVADQEIAILEEASYSLAAEQCH